MSLDVASGVGAGADSFRATKISPSIGAEIHGVDLRAPITPALKQKLLDAWHEHLIILLRDQNSTRTRRFASQPHSANQLK